MKGKHGVAIVSMAICAVIAVWGVWQPAQMTGSAMALTTFALQKLDWLFLGACTLFLALSLFLAVGPYGKIKLGADDEEPEFDTISWLSMMFAGGMGAGLLFWGVAEPIYHFDGPPGEVGRTAEAARTAFVITNFHWGLHAWAIYGVCSLVIAYFCFRRGAPAMVSAPITHSLRPVLGDRATTVLAKTSDVVGVLAVVFGIAGSLAMGVLMTRSGMTEVFATPADNMMNFYILAAMTVMFLISACTGVDKGIKFLSNFNMFLALIIMLVVLFAGPTTFIFDVFITSLGDYVSNIIDLSFRIFAYDDALRSWTHGWTLTYLIWWIAWGPFVGIFVARISRGRTIREFCLGVILVPTVFSMLWFAIFGGTAVYIEMFGSGGLTEFVKEDVNSALFKFFGYLPMTQLLNVFGIVLIFIFLVTGADSGTYVISMMATNGNLNPSMTTKITWGLIMSVITMAVLFSGSVEVAKAMAITGAVPYTFIVLLQIAGFLRALREDRAKSAAGGRPALAEAE